MNSTNGRNCSKRRGERYYVWTPRPGMRVVDPRVWLTPPDSRYGADSVR
jgi:hypothetical protein